MSINATLETRTSKEGKTYKCVVIKISENSEKVVFLSPAELELLELNAKKANNNTYNELEMPDFR